MLIPLVFSLPNMQIVLSLTSRYEQRNNTAVAAWHSCAIDMFVQFVSEACVERVFSVLQNAMDDRQEHSLRDYTEAKVLVRYNNRRGQD